MRFVGGASPDNNGWSRWRRASGIVASVPGAASQGTSDCGTGRLSLARVRAHAGSDPRPRPRQVGPQHHGKVLGARGRPTWGIARLPSTALLETRTRWEPRKEWAAPATSLTQTALSELAGYLSPGWLRGDSPRHAPWRSSSRHAQVAIDVVIPLRATFSDTGVVARWQERGYGGRAAVGWVVPPGHGVAVSVSHQRVPQLVR